MTFLVQRRGWESGKTFYVLLVAFGCLQGLFKYYSGSEMKNKWQRNQTQGRLTSDPALQWNGNIEQQSDNRDGITWMRIQNVMSLYTKRGENHDRREKQSFLLVLYMISHVVADERRRGRRREGKTHSQIKAKRKFFKWFVFKRDILIRGRTWWKSREKLEIYCENLKAQP